MGGSKELIFKDFLKSCVCSFFFFFNKLNCSVAHPGIAFVPCKIVGNVCRRFGQHSWEKLLVSSG